MLPANRKSSLMRGGDVRRSIQFKHGCHAVEIVVEQAGKDGMFSEFKWPAAAIFDSVSVTVIAELDNPGDICSLCQGGEDKNPNKEPEELVKCASCKRSGHPSCLELTEEMIPIIKTYSWQCMECKSCVECKKPTDEDKMMFCDHCDRGYHTYCCGVSRIPTGRWECSSCTKSDVKMEVKDEAEAETKSEENETDSTKASDAPTPQPPRAKRGRPRLIKNE